MSGLDVRGAIALYESGLSLADVGRRFGVTRQSVYSALKRRGVALRPQLRMGAENHFYRGGPEVCGYVTERGYVKVRTEDGRKVFKHRYVMEQSLGRKLQADEDVHHKNGDKSDNRSENLEVIPHGKHSSLHHRGVQWRRQG